MPSTAFATTTPTHPLILALDLHGMPQRWINWQDACFYYARNLVAWAAGEYPIIVSGGISRLSGERSHITASSIIAIKGPARGHLHFYQAPPLSNRELFERDHRLCAYCGHTFPLARLTRDHILPLSRGGADHWMNVVTACRTCNQKKGCRTPEKSAMPLLYAPYVPNKAEYLILCNRQILADQMDFLNRHLSEKHRSQLHNHKSTTC